MTSAISDEDLYDLCAGFVEASLAAVRPAMERLEVVPTRERVDHITREDGRRSVSFREDPDVGSLLFRGEKQDLPEFKSLVQRIAESDLAATALVDAGGKPIEDAKGQAWWLLNFYFRPLLIRYIGPDLKSTFDDARLRAIFPSFQESLSAKEIVHETVAALRSFGAESANVDLGHGLAVRRLSTEEIDLLWRTSQFGTLPGGHDVFSLEFCLAIRSRRPKVGQAPPSPAHELLASAVTAFRLTKEGQVGIAATADFIKEPAFGRTGTSVTSGFLAGGGEPVFHLDQADESGLSTLISAVKRAREVDLLGIALRRFELAYERSRPEDRLIDYWIALESLFLKRNERQELGYRAALRMARFVGSDPDEREEIFRKVKKSYSARSDVVHGGPLPKETHETTCFTEEQLRRALREIVLTGSLPALDSLDVEAARARVEEA